MEHSIEYSGFMNASTTTYSSPFLPYCFQDVHNYEEGFVYHDLGQSPQDTITLLADEAMVGLSNLLNFNAVHILLTVV
jgi:hypothetical protein